MFNLEDWDGGVNTARWVEEYLHLEQHLQWKKKE
jgi:putative protein kinase ArgK-like GTPase of G3E family